MESHKRVLAILYIVSGILNILLFIGLSFLFNFILGMAMHEVSEDERWVLEFVNGFVRFLPIIMIVLFGIPSVIAGVGLLNGHRWALVLALVVGCFKLLNFPLGTALGVYTIWVYLEDQKQIKTA
jgi:hypothetical protein